MVLTRSEKEQAVIELYKQGKTYRQIAELLHVSFGDISFIVRRETGEADEQKRIRMSKSSQALKMFEEGNTAVQVAIKLDIETREVDRLYREYWNLKGLHNLLQVYEEIKGSIFSFVKLYQLTKQEGMNLQEVVNALKIVERLPLIKDEYDCIRDNVYAFRYQRQKLENDLYILNKQKESSANELQSFREYRDNELKSMQEEIVSAQEQTELELNKQKQFLANEVDKYKASLARESKFLQAGIDKLKKEEQELTGHIQILNNEELEILRLVEGQRRRKQQQEQSIQELQSQSQPPLKQQSVFIALAHELHTQAT